MVDYTADELVYWMRNKRTHKNYGYSPVEQVLITVNIADPRNPAFVSYRSLAAPPNAVAVSGHTVLVADQEAGLYQFDSSACGASGCSLSCTPTVPETAVAGSAVTYQGTFLQSGCTGTPTFDASAWPGSTMRQASSSTSWAPA